MAAAATVSTHSWPSNLSLHMALPSPAPPFSTRARFVSRDTAHRSSLAVYNALAVARFLLEREDVEAVRYPGLPSDPSHALAKRQMRRFGPVVTFDLGSKGRAERFLAKAKLIWEATSFGGCPRSFSVAIAFALRPRQADEQRP